MFNYRFQSMSTIVQISINQELFANDLMPIYKLFDLVDTTCSRFRVDSELSRLNLQVEKEVMVSNEMFAILVEADRFYQDTNGVFNPSVLTALENNGYLKSIEFIKGLHVNTSALTTQVSSLSRPYTLNKEQQTVFLHSRIDLGGIAKGWVIDRAGTLLEQMGYGFINVGGDIRIFGELPRPLNIGIENPFEEALMISSIHVREGAVATSTSKKRTWFVEGRWRHHLIDTRTGQPSESAIVSATVTAPTALEADVWAKTALLLGEKLGKEWVTQKDVHAVFINKNGEIWKGET